MNLMFFSINVKDAYLTALNSKKIYCVARPEFGSKQGKTFMVIRALYAIKYAGAALRKFLAIRLNEIRSGSSHADPSV